LAGGDPLVRATSGMTERHPLTKPEVTLWSGSPPGTIKNPPESPFAKGGRTPLAEEPPSAFSKWFGMLTILSSSKEGGGEGFGRFIF
jgi:hypothetical protein